MFKSILYNSGINSKQLISESKVFKTCEIGKGVYLFSFCPSLQTMLLKPQRKVHVLKSSSVPPHQHSGLLVQDSTSPCKPSHSSSQFLLNLWHENPNLPHTHFITLLTLTLLNSKYEASCSPALTFLQILPSHCVFIYVSLKSVCPKCLTSCLNTTLDRNSLQSRGLFLEQPQLRVQQALFFPSEPSFI